MTISGFVQAGGASRRMGENKALLMLAGRPMIDYPLSTLKPLVSQLAIITNSAADYQQFGIACYQDRWPGLGPLGGIGSALTVSTNDYGMMVACDMPFVS